MSQYNLYKLLRKVCFISGFGAIVQSIFFWFNTAPNSEALAILHDEHISLFVGLWAPTLFILASIFNSMAEKTKNNGK